MPWLIKAQPWDHDAEAVTTEYFSDVGFTTEPGDTPANTHYLRRITAPMTSSRALWSGGDVGGFSETEFGRAVLAGDDGALDHLWDHDWGGRLVQIWYTPVERPVLADFVLMFNGTAEDFVPGVTDAVIELRDLQVLLDVLFGRGTFAGAGGVEGTAELTGRNKPVCLGRCYRFEPVLIDSANDVYMVDPLGFHALLAAEDAGDPHTVAGSDYADYAALVAADLSAVDYATCEAEGLYRNSGTPAGRLLLTVEGVAPGGTWISSFADLVAHIATTMTSFTSGDLATAAFAAVATAQPAPLQYWWDGSGSKTVRQVIDELADTAGAYWGIDDDRKLEIGIYTGPAGTADFAFGPREIFELDPQLVDRRMKSLRVGWGRYWSTLDEGDMSPTVAAADREAFKSEYRWTATATHAGAAAAALLARDEELRSLFVNQADAEDERDRRLDLYGPKAKGFQAEVPLTEGLRAGHTVELTDDRYGLEAGWLGVVLEAEKDADEEVHRLTVVGPA